MSNWSPLVKKYREVRGLTQAQLASQLNVAANTVSRWETGAYEVSGEFTWVLTEEFFGTPDTSEISNAIRFLSGLQTKAEAAMKQSNKEGSDE